MVQSAVVILPGCNARFPVVAQWLGEWNANWFYQYMRLS